MKIKQPSTSNNEQQRGSPNKNQQEEEEAACGERGRGGGYTSSEVRNEIRLFDWDTNEIQVLETSS